MNKTPNNSIKCSVNSCAYHCGEQILSTLNEIQAGLLRLQRDQLRLHRVRLLPVGRPRRLLQALNRPSMKSRVPDGERAIFMVFTPWARQAPRPWGRQRPPLQASPPLEPRA